MSCCGGSPPDEAFQELAASLPITVRTPGEIPSVPFKQHHDRRLLGCVISELDPNFVHRPLHIKGVETEHHPLHCILDLSEEEHPANPHLAAELTATYPEVWDKAHGRKIISNYPNQDAFFTKVYSHVTYGGTFDGCGGTGPDQAWLGANLGMATAMRVLDGGAGQLAGSQDACRLMEKALQECHRQLMTHDERGSATALLHICVRLSEQRFLFFFACLGDTEVMWYDSARSKWRYLVEPSFASGGGGLRVDSSQMPGAIGGVAADKYDPLKYRENMNLQFGMVAAQPDDIFLMASDGLWDTLDPVQAGPPQVLRQSLNMRVLSKKSWSDIAAEDPRLSAQITERLPVLKAAKLSDAVGVAAAKADVNQVVAAAVAHAMEATRGQREMHARYEGNPKSSESMHDPGPTGRSHMHEARAAAEARGDYIFAKPDHLGIQAFRPKAMTYAAESQNTLLRMASRFQRTLTRTMSRNPFHPYASKSAKTTGGSFARTKTGFNPHAKPMSAPHLGRLSEEITGSDFKLSSG